MWTKFRPELRQYLIHPRPIQITHRYTGMHKLVPLSLSHLLSDCLFHVPSDEERTTMNKATKLTHHETISTQLWGTLSDSLTVAPNVRITQEAQMQGKKCNELALSSSHFTI